MTDRHADDLDLHALSPDRPPAWWGVTPAATPRPGWTDWRPRRADWADVLEPDPFDPAGPWRLAAVWLLGVPLLAFVGSFVLLVVCMRGRVEPVYSLVSALELNFGEWTVLAPCAVPAAAAGGLWLLPPRPAGAGGEAGGAPLRGRRRVAVPVRGGGGRRVRPVIVTTAGNPGRTDAGVASPA